MPSPSSTTTNPKPPRTEAQRAAARANGAKSRGPVTPEGKARSARNSFRHGLSNPHVAAELTCLYVEDRAEFVVMHEALADQFGPVTAAEALLVEEMAVCRWRLTRAWYMERGVMNEEMANMHTDIENCVEGIDGALRAAAGFRQLALNHARTLGLLDRYETRLSRQFDRALRRFRDLRAHPTAPPPPPAPEEEELSAPNEPGRPHPVNDDEEKPNHDHQPPVDPAQPAASPVPSPVPPADAAAPELREPVEPGATAAAATAAEPAAGDLHSDGRRPAPAPPAAPATPPLHG